MRIAMWSGPRNISTAMMRAWENRGDCAVWDEPLYGYYLHKTGISHPGAAEIIAAQGDDWRAVVNRCSHESPGQAAIFYQKHMTLHLLPEIDKQWLASLENCFLIRDPAAVIASYAAVRSEVTLDDIGFWQQFKLFDYVADKTGKPPIVIDSREFLLNPEGMLREICDRLNIAFDINMLKWRQGVRDSDGVWAKYWYGSVWKSTGFSHYIEKPLDLSDRERMIADQAQPYYEILHKHRLKVQNRA
ncbi:MAG: sulfotransferase [Gammaproteobacteria bacterium]|nr:sulfotransferase [Gammaproteobacteria bacterium]